MDNTNDFTAGLIAGENRNGNGNGWGNGFGGEGLWLFAILALMGGGFGNWGGNRNGEVVTEATLCNANSFSELKGSVGRLSDQVANMYTGLQNGLCIEKLVLENKYQAAQNTAEINANTTAQVQKVLDLLCGNRMADMQNQINQLQLQSALCGIVRYPTQTTYGAGFNPFFNSGCGCNGCGNGNI